jgi:hypothetical protein
MRGDRLMAGRFDNASVSGEKECIAAFKRLPDVAKDRFGDATQKTAFALLQREKAGVHVLSGALKAALDYSYSKTTGVALVGIAKGAAAIPIPGSKGKHANPAQYGHSLEFGHGGPYAASPHPFAIPAAEAEKDPFLDRCRTAGKEIERDMEHVGGSFL